DLAPSGTYSAMAEWVGIDGAANSSLIQAGVGESYDPTTNLVQIQPWWEILPAPETPITSLTVVPGNTVTVAIGQSSASTWTIQVTNDSTGQSFATDQPYTGPLSSAEWIVEAPTVSSSGAVAALGAYSPNITFTGLQSVGTSLGTTAVVMEQSGQVVSVPSPLTAVGFTVAYGSTTPAAP
ncbi:MAG: G1 family glutamic endopeptidase, partial [Candidatus Dormibacteria bacterium]